MTDDFDADMLELTLHEAAAVAHLGYLSAEPGGRTDGEWVLLFEEEEGAPIELAHVGSGFDFQRAPIGPTERALTAAGYSLEANLVVRPWAASWRLVSAGGWNARVARRPRDP